MMHRFQKVSILILLTLLIATPVFAQDGAGPATFAGRYSLWAAIIIGFVASIVTLFYGYQLKGGVVGTTLSLIGAGMFLVVLGFLAVAVPWAASATQALVHDIMFIIGYVLMLVGAYQLRKVT